MCQKSRGRFAILKEMLIDNKLEIGALSFVIIIISVILHELAHGYAAKQLGDDTAEAQGRLTFNPFAHVDPFMTVLLPLLLAISGQPVFGAAKPVPISRHKLKWDEFGMAIVGFAGPFTNLVLAVLGGAILRGNFSTGSLWVTWWFYFIAINIGFFVFNILPIPPLDGSRVLYAFAPEFLQEFMDKLERYGIFVILILVVLGYSFISPIIYSLDQHIMRFILG
jgi:Zn-dependent protease